jgi:alpha-glucosidase
VSRPNWLLSVHHDGSPKYVSESYPIIGDIVSVRLRAGSNAPIKRVYVRTFPDGEQALTPMAELAVNPPCRWWEAEIEISQADVHYRFLIVAADGLWWYTAAGATEHIPRDDTDFRLLAGYHSPDWLDSAVFYQIFPDRFANGRPDNDPLATDFEYRGAQPQTYPWGQEPAEDQPFSLVFYGGDIPGIIQNLGYLDRLGVNALYLNPVFTAYSNHKYDVIDYDKVDPHLGGNKALIALRQELNERGMHYILDIVPNHCGYWHPWFQTARTDRHSAEAGFFTFNRYPDEYATWLGVWSLPKLNYHSRELRRRMYQNDNSVFRKWLKPPFAADGWRVDVANMLGRQGEIQLAEEIVFEIREAVKSVQKNSYLMGEHFFDASPQLQGDQWDAVMNYSGFTLPLWHWLDHYKERAHHLEHEIRSPISWSTTALAKTWQSRRAAVPWVIARQQFNILGSHDTPRIRNIAHQNDALQRLAAAVQFTYLGIPCIYYGDEIGMGDDQHLQSRGCMIWNPELWDHDLLTFYQKLISLRKSSSALRRGGFQMLMTEKDTFAYLRESNSERIVVVADRGQTVQAVKPLPVAHGGIGDGCRFREYFSGQEITVSGGKLLLPSSPQGATIWVEMDK